ncbi:MAG TPA: DUF4178 domain-containing protein, partial [Thermoanaerobaculia bacterium]
ICNYCRSVVARTDRGVESHGKVAALIDTGSPLRTGTTGRYKANGFRITGRTQLRHQAGGVWDEWYAAFDDGRWGWLAEAQGRFYVTFKVAADAPPLERLQLGAPVPALDDLVVAEIGEAALISAEGELPWTPEPNGVYEYADLTGAGRHFATIDYSEEPPVVFKGNETTLDELGIAAGEARSTRVAAKVLNCTNCGGALELRAPDQAERIWCPYCGAGHDIANGKLEYFAMLKKQRVEPAIPLGSSGTIEGDAYVIAGFMQRSVRFDITYYWTEYLLYNAAKGYRWLVHSDEHWSFVTPLRPGEVRDPTVGESIARSVSYEGRSYRLFQSATAKVSYVVGEFYWRVEVGETVDTADYVAPPFGISKEMTKSGAREVSYSHARYMPTSEVAEAFQVRDLTLPTTIGPMQPFTGAKLGRTWAFMTLLLLITAMVLSVMLPRRQLLEQLIDITATPPQAGSPAESRMIFSEPFTLDGKHNVEVRANANLENSWLYVGGNLVNDLTGRFEGFELPLEYYHGYDGGESWSEGRRGRSVHLAPPPAGRYTLALALQWEPGKTPPPLHVHVREGVFRWPYFLLAFVALSIIPLFAAIRRVSFESQRWKDSTNSPFEYSKSFGDEDDDDEE